MIADDALEELSAAGRVSAGARRRPTSCTAGAQRPDPGDSSPAAARSRRSARAGRAAGAELVIFDVTLLARRSSATSSGRSSRRVLDRTALILDIFAQRAQQPRRQAAGRAGAARAPVDAPGARLDPPRAPARRPRQDRRPRREADRDSTAG
ncbi:MAG: hypothetical protein MZW92_04065 [Comamonadaceae bacterium]|nr:hypothetical protein [Comamonadaceae bacterium]